jgi:PIN domain nuclease of toxin-antitoxin system
MKAVLDASALLAYLQDEPGRDAVEAVLTEFIISSVNWGHWFRSIPNTWDGEDFCQR